MTPVSFRRRTGSRSVDGMGRNTTGFTPYPWPNSLPSSHSLTERTQSHQIQFDLVPACLGKKQNPYSDNHDIGIKCKPRKIQSAQSKKAISTSGHTLLPCFT